MSVNLGYNRRESNLARFKQGEVLSPVRPQAFTEIRGEVNKMMTDFCKMEKVYYTNTGAEGNEKAIAMSRMMKGLPNGLILSRFPSYHGSTSVAMSASGDFRIAVRGEIPGHVRVKDTPHEYPYRERHDAPSVPQDSEMAV